PAARNDRREPIPMDSARLRARHQENVMNKDRVRRCRSGAYLAAALSVLIAGDAGARPPSEGAVPEWVCGPTQAMAGWAGCRTLPPGDDGQRGVFVPQLWPDGIVYYTFDSHFSDDERQAILSAWATLSSVANVQFVPRANQPNYVHVTY